MMRNLRWLVRAGCLAATLVAPHALRADEPHDWRELASSSSLVVTAEVVDPEIHLFDPDMPNVQRMMSGGRVVHMFADPDDERRFVVRLTPVTIHHSNAIPLTSSFGGWHGGCTGTGDCELVLSTNAALKAVLQPLPVRPRAPKDKN